MRDHDIYVVKYTEKVPYGAWVAHDEKRIDGYSEPREFSDYYVSPSPEIAKAHWDYWAKLSSPTGAKTFVSIERVGRPTMLIEFR